MGDCHIRRLTQKRGDQLVRDMFMPAVTAEIEHEHALARQILGEFDRDEMTEIFLTLWVEILEYHAANQGMTPLELAQRMGIVAAQEVEE